MFLIWLIASKIISRLLCVICGSVLLVLTPKILTGYSYEIFGIHSKYMGVLVLLILILILIFLFSIGYVIYPRVAEATSQTVSNKQNIPYYLNLITALGNCLLSLVSAVYIGVVLFYITKTANHLGVVVSSSWCQIKRVFSISEKLEWLRDVKNAHFMEIPEETWNNISSALTFKDIHTQQDLYLQLTNIINTVNLKITNNLADLKAKLLEHQHTYPLPHHISINSYVQYAIYVVGAVALGGLIYWQWTNIAAIAQSAYNYFKEDNAKALGNILSDGYTVAKESLVANATHLNATENLASYAERLAGLTNMSAKAIAHLVKQNTNILLELNTMKDAIRVIASENAHLTKETGNLSILVTDLINVVSHVV